MTGKIRKVGPHSRPTTLRKLDERTREAALMRKTRAALVAHVGGRPSATEAMLIDRACRLTLHVELFEKRLIENGPLDERDTRTYLAYSNSLTRTLRELGMKAAAIEPPSIAEHLAKRRAAGGDAAA